MGTKLANSSSSRIHLYVWMFWRCVAVACVLSMRRKFLTGMIKGLGFIGSECGDTTWVQMAYHTVSSQAHVNFVKLSLKLGNFLN